MEILKSSGKSLGFIQKPILQCIVGRVLKRYFYAEHIFVTHKDNRAVINELRCVI